MDRQRAAITRLRHQIEDLYAVHSAELPYHGWHHVEFVASKAKKFAEELDADVDMTEVAALIHDLNYIVDPKSNAEAGSGLRSQLLSEAGFDARYIKAVEVVVIEADIRTRDGDISGEAKALSDADTLFKALPLTPNILAPLYLRETGQTLRGLAEKIVQEQIPLRSAGIYFYSESAKRRYAAWASANLELWRCLLDSLGDPDVLWLLGKISPVAGGSTDPAL